MQIKLSRNLLGLFQKAYFLIVKLGTAEELCMKKVVLK